MKGRLFIHATNVHQGGGRFLLTALLNALPNDRKYVLTLDRRMIFPDTISPDTNVRFVEPSIRHRFAAEQYLSRIVVPGDIVLCFGNLPPLFKLRGHVVVFLQNRYLIDEVMKNGFSSKVRLRLAIEKLWFSKKTMNTDQFVVQTQTMKKLLETRINKKIPVMVLPFVENPNGYGRSAPHQRNGKSKKKYDFIYVASGEPHKNHQHLLDAWCLLADEGILPSLCFTLDENRFVEIMKNVNLIKKNQKLKITNTGKLPHKDVLALYRQSAAMIYPSAFESFGIPLIEARQAGLPVLAPELDYVRDVLDPEETFDPESPRSIARAVKRFMGIEEKPLPLFDAEQFLASILEKAE
jgi:glycosyltransferase involved in cell wall biosynthesis